jgi:hypothetical protein
MTESTNPARKTSIVPAIVASVVAAAILSFGLRATQSAALPFLGGAFALAVGSFLTLFYYKKLVVALIVGNVAFLAIANDVFHYSLTYALAQDALLALALALAFARALSENEPIDARLTYLRKPALLLVAYFSVVAFVGFSRGHDSLFLLDEWYHVFLYYALAIPLFYALREREEYDRVFFVVLIAMSATAVQIVLKNYNMGVYRFITFQSGMFPVVLAVAAAWLSKARTTALIKGVVAFASLLVVAGLYYSYARSLWVSCVVALVVVFFFLLHEKKGARVTKLVFYLAALALPILLLRGSDGPSASTNQEIVAEEQTRDVEYRAQSIADPGRDPSFLMRIELGYYIYLKILDHPIFGAGFGDWVRYKILSESVNPINYPDNAWLFFLWKGGAVGLAIVVWFYWRFFRQTFRVYRNSSSPRVRAVALGLFAGYLGVMVYSLFTSNLIKYKYGSLFAISFAYIEFESAKIKESNDESSVSS